MGALCDFQCKGCGYQTRVSGGPDHGFTVETNTMVCLDCRELVDVITGIVEGAPEEMVSCRESDIGTCPNCKGRSLAAWHTSTPCPKCGQQMTQGDPVLYWD